MTRPWETIYRFDTRELHWQREVHFPMAEHSPAFLMGVPRPSLYMCGPLAVSRA